MEQWIRSKLSIRNITSPFWNLTDTISIFIGSWKLLTNVSWKSLTCLTLQSASHLSMLPSPKIKTTVLNSPMHYGDTLYWNLFLKKTCSFLVWRKIKYNLLPLVMFTSQCLTIDKSTGTPEKDYQIVVFYYTKQTKSKTIKSKLWGAKNSKSILKCHLLSKFL